MSWRIYLSPPDVGAAERELLLDAFDSNWIAPLGPHVDAFERELAETTGAPHAVALSSGTAALHLALLLVGVRPGDVVIAPTLTFVASVNPIRYAGATPTLVDVEPVSWNVDPELLDEELSARRAAGDRVGAVIVVDLYGQPADWDPIRRVCRAYDVPVVEDAAEALGASHGDRWAGTLGDVGVLSFNGNKIITTSGGGALLLSDGDQARHARHLATQARETARHYEHHELGFNYRLSNLLAALGRGQLRSLEERVARRRSINARYREAFAELPGVEVAPEPPWGRGTFWLTCLTIDPAVAGHDRDVIIDALGAAGIEARPVWKPMHLQPLYADASIRGGEVAERCFRQGVCLPSGSSLTDGEVDEIGGRVRDALQADAGGR